MRSGNTRRTACLGPCGIVRRGAFDYIIERPLLFLLGLQTSRQFPEVSRKVSGNLESFHSKISGKFPEKFGNSERKKLERNKDIGYMLTFIDFCNVC